MRKFLAIITFVVALGACVATPQSAEEQLAAVELTFTGLIEQLSEARNMGLIEDDTLWACIQTTAVLVDRGLDTAHRYFNRGASIALIIGAVQAQINALQRMEATGEHTCGNSPGVPSSHTGDTRSPKSGYGIQFDSDKDAD